tara:strand:+ start:4121 stop:4291 length:171 start_codon:yes stop_codon:yes gene_type:complete
MKYKKRNSNLTRSQRIKKRKQKKIKIAEEERKNNEFYNNPKPTFIQKVKKILLIKK